MPSTVRSAKGASPRSVSPSSGRRSKYASRSACCAASSPVSSRRSWPGGGSVERDPELIHLPVERRQREAERLRRLTLVVAEPPQHRETVRARHAQVRDDDGEVVLVDRLQGCRAVGG